MTTITNADVFDYVTMMMYKSDHILEQGSFHAYCIQHKLYDLAEEVLGFVKFNHRLGLLPESSREKFLRLFQVVGISKEKLNALLPHLSGELSQSHLLSEHDFSQSLCEDYRKANHALLFSLQDLLEERIKEAQKNRKNHELSLPIQWVGQQPRADGFIGWACVHWNKFRTQSEKAIVGFEREQFVDLHGKFLLYCLNTFKQNPRDEDDMYSIEVTAILDMLQDLDLADKVLAWKKQRMLQSV